MSADAPAAVGAAPASSTYTDEDDARDAAAEAASRDADDAENGAYVLEEHDIAHED